MLISCAPLIAEHVQKVPGKPITIQIDNSVEHQTMDGFGATTLASILLTKEGVKDILTPELRRRAIETLYGRVGLTMGNLEFWFEPSNDDDNPFNYNWSGFKWESFDAMHDLLVQPAGTFGFNNYALGLKINTRWGLKWMTDLRETDYERYLNEVAEYVSAGAIYWRKISGHIPRYIMLFNEPLSGNRELKGGTTNEVIDIVKYAGDRLRAEGFNNVKFIVPGEETEEKSIETARAILADEKARQYIGVLAYHAYPYGSPYSSVRRILETTGSGQPHRGELQVRKEIKQLGKRYRLPVWMNEISEGPGNADFEFNASENLRARAIHIHDELVYANASAFFGMYNMWDRQSHTIHFKGRKVDFTTQTSHIALIDQKISRIYITGMGYAIGHYARWIKQGAIRIDATSNDSLVQVTAFRDVDSGFLIIVIINNYDKQQEITVKLKNLRIDGPIMGEQSGEEARWEKIGPFDSSEHDRFRMMADPNSVITVSAPLHNSY